MTTAPHDPGPDGLDAPDPARIVTRRDFGRELTLAKDQAGASVRSIARAIGAPPSTVGGYLSGRHLPALHPPDQLTRILAACDITDEETVAAWRAALRRARRAAGEQYSPTSPADAGRDATSTVDGPAPHAAPVDREVVVSVHPPVARLDQGPTIRGREELLRALSTEVDQLCNGPRSAVPVTVLHGLAGSGKSTVALLLARYALEHGVRTWWVGASDPDTTAAAMRAVAFDLGADPDRMRVDRGPDPVWRALEQCDEPWLLVVDDGDDPAGLSLPGHPLTEGNGWVRPVRTGRGLVVVTTRDGGSVWGDPPAPWVRLVPTDRLTPEDSVLLLRELAGPDAGSDGEAHRLADRLGGLPLALCLAGRHIAEARRIPAAFAGPDDARSFADYDRALTRGRYPADIGDAWELSLDLLARRGLPQARPVLRLLSCLGPGPVACGLILRPATLSRSPLIGPISGRMVWEILTALAGLGIVELTHREVADPALAAQAQSHPLVRSTSRHSADLLSHLDSYVALSAALVAEAADDLDPKNPADWPRWRALVEHSTGPLDLAAELHLSPRSVPAQAVSAATACARYLRAAGDLDRAESLYRRLARVAAAALGDADPRVLTVRHDLCRVWYDLGRLHEAVRGLRAVLRERSRVLGPDHPDTLTTQHYLARALRDEGQTDAAFRLFRQTLDARRRTLGPDHPDTLTSRNNAADALRALGRLDAAAQELRAVHEARVRVLGPEHPATLVSRYNLVRLTLDLDDLTGAEEEISSLVQTYTRVLGPDHPRTLLARQAQVDVWHDLGDLDQARQAVEEVLQARLRLLGPRHPATLVSRHRRALLLIDLGQHEQAEQELLSVLADRRLVLGPRHADTILARSSLDALRSRHTR